MIYTVLNILTEDLNRYLQRALKDGRKLATLSGLGDQDGEAASGGGNQVICTLIGVEQDMHNLNRPVRSGPKVNPPIFLNLRLLLSAHCPGNYPESLKFLGHMVEYFQRKQVFTPSNTPDLPDALEKLTVDIENLSQRESNELWGAIGAKLVPSLCIRLKTLPIQSNNVLEEVEEIRGVATSASVSHPRQN